jgi:hypothetical protein
MKTTKILSVFAIFFLAVFAISSVSALTIGAPSNDLTLSNPSATLVITSPDAVTGTLALNPTVLQQDGSTATLALDTNALSVSSGTPQTVTVSLTGTTGTFDFANLNSVLTASGTNSSGDSVSATQTVTFFQGFCSSGPAGGNLEITDIDIDNRGEGKDDEWELLDEIEIEVDVENDGADDVDDVIVELALFDSNGDDATSDLDFENTDEEEIDVGRIRDDDKETVVFRFKVTADMVEDGYSLAIKAYSDDNDVTEANECTEEVETIDVVRKDKEEEFLAIDDLEINPTDITCGDVVDMSFDIVNVGDEEIEDRIRVHVESSQLDLELEQDIRTDLDEGDSESVSFSFNVPNNLEDGVYNLNIWTEHDYKESADSFRTQSEDEKVTIRLLGCSFEPTESSGFVSISASLDSEAKAGSDLVVTTSVTNLLDESQTVVVSAEDFSDWADLKSISSSILVLNRGETKDVTLTFGVMEDAEGQESFKVTTRSGDQVTTRSIGVNVESQSTSSSGIGNISSVFGDNSLLWVIGIINIVLIVLIIIVAVRLSRR